MKVLASIPQTVVSDADTNMGPSLLGPILKFDSDDPFVVMQRL